MARPDAVYPFVGAFFDALAEEGVAAVCVSPGSRSTPLAIAAERCPSLEVTTHIDERSGGFFALGLAKASRAPVALVCTSGTAAANWLPAVIEAHYARVPLLLLTADRPPELREWGAGQTIDQVHLYGRHVRWYGELPVPEAWGEEEARLRYARTMASRAVAEACGARPGPVHLNWPLREPLEPRPGEPAARRAHRRPPSTVRSAPTVDERAVEELCELASRHERGLIACGPLDEGPELALAVARLASAAGWPVLADPTSQVRWGPHTAAAPICASLDFVLRDEAFAAANAPEVVVRVGATPVCKSFRLWLEQHAPETVWLVDPGGGWEEPSHLASRVLRCDPAALFRAAAARLCAERGAPRASAWRSAFESAEQRAQEALAAGCEAEPRLLEPQVVRALAAALPEEATLYVSNSMPVRDLDAFLPVDPRRLRVLANRGASGIDGVTSSALGAAAAGVGGPVVLLTGDLAFLHDLGGLLAARRHGLQLTILVLNNDGGGIFSFLPIASQGEAVSFESLFRTSHGLEFEAAARLFGLEYARVEGRDDLGAALGKALGADESWIIEVPIDRDANVAHYRALVARVGASLRDASTPS